ncbi:hypothetical protein RIR_jg29043.t1 [Rhizophagus irregularis DAOM 181602=DAOM 197198]|nr:hypothetical protein RIR_jg29043.t1 [Rhizophagus irregularis DAOM 181602=DAOM 197198]
MVHHLIVVLSLHCCIGSNCSGCNCCDDHKSNTTTTSSMITIASTTHLPHNHHHHLPPNVVCNALCIVLVGHPTGKWEPADLLRNFLKWVDLYRSVKKKTESRTITTTISGLDNYVGAKSANTQRLINVTWKTRIRNASNFDNANYNEDYDEENMKNIKKNTAVQNLFSSDKAQDAALQST